MFRTVSLFALLVALTPAISARAQYSLDYQWLGRERHLTITPNLKEYSFMTIREVDGLLEITETGFYVPDVVTRELIPNGWIVVDMGTAMHGAVTFENISADYLSGIQVNHAASARAIDCILDKFSASRCRRVGSYGSVIDVIDVHCEKLSVHDSIASTVEQSSWIDFGLRFYERGRYWNEGSLLWVKNSMITNQLEFLGTNNNDTVELDGLSSGSPTITVVAYNGNDWMEARNSSAGFVSINAGWGSDTYKDRGGNNWAVRHPATVSVEYRK